MSISSFNGSESEKCKTWGGKMGCGGAEVESRGCGCGSMEYGGIRIRVGSGWDMTC